jgi:hypothetical protein
MPPVSPTILPLAEALKQAEGMADPLVLISLGPALGVVSGATLPVTPAHGYNLASITEMINIMRDGHLLTAYIEVVEDPHGQGYKLRPHLYDDDGANRIPPYVYFYQEDIRH